MVALALACSLAWIAEAPAPSAEDQAQYREARRSAGRNAEAHVRLALWCEARGLEAERDEHLATAILAEPSHVSARGLLGLPPEDAKGEAGASLAEARAEYVARRDRSPDTAEGHWRLALWCRHRGLEAEAVAHFTAVTRLDPGRAAAWKRLGYERHGGRWLTREQIAEVRVERARQQQADAYWRPTLARWKSQSAGADEARRDEAEAGLGGVTDPRALPSVWAVFVAASGPDRARAAQLLGQIDSRESSVGLALLAAFDESAEVRRAATETLALRGAPEPLVALLRDPIRFEVKPVGGPDDPGALLLDAGRFNLLRLYGPVVPEIARMPGVFRGYDQDGNPFSSVALRHEVHQAASASAARLAQDLGEVLDRNAVIGRGNDRVAGVLDQVAPGEEIGDVEGWRRWLADRLGYTYQEPRAFDGPTLVQEVASYPARSFGRVTSWSPTSCFAPGTPVRTRDGARPIETLKVGDLVLAQDPATGALAYRPVVQAFHNLPAPTWAIDLGGDGPIEATGLHRFWIAGRGWVMARDLAAGDRLRTLGGSARVASARRRTFRPAFNLEVAGAHTFFVGDPPALVHDNTPANPVAEPFDTLR